MDCRIRNNSGFTLIELSIVLVIIGLLVGGVLVGQDLISAAAVRAQISQIEKYQTAVNTFRVKYGYLPGDIPDPTASAFGFYARGGGAQAEGDGNGLIEGQNGNVTPGVSVFCGEAQLFWTDLSQANMIDGGGYSASNLTCGNFTVTPSQVANYLPAAKIGQGNFVFVWSGGWLEIGNYNFGTSQDRYNYFGLSAVIGSSGVPGFGGIPFSNVSISAAQAYAIDSKIDDGLPQTGRVLAMYPALGTNFDGGWAAGGTNITAQGVQAWGDYSTVNGGPVTNPGNIGDGTAAGPYSCFDGSAGLPEKYSMEINHGSGQNCALSFRFQ